MKHPILLFFFLISLNISAQDINKGLVVDMPMDGNTLDRSKYKNNGILDKVTSVEDRFGRSNSAYSFSYGSSITIPHTKSLNIKKELSISIWIKKEKDSSKSMRIVDKNSAGGNDGFMLDTHANYGTGLRFIVSNFSNDISSIPSKKWIHIVVTYGKGRLCYYIDGKLVKDTKAPKNYIGQNELPLMLGISQGELSKDEYFRGCMDDFRLYNRVLTKAEVDILYKAD